MNKNPPNPQLGQSLTAKPKHKTTPENSKNIWLKSVALAALMAFAVQAPMSAAATKTAPAETESAPSKNKTTAKKATETAKPTAKTTAKASSKSETKLAAADEDAPKSKAKTTAKATTSKTKAKAEKSDTKLADADDEKTEKTSAKSTSKTVKAKSKSKLASADTCEPETLKASAKSKKGKAKTEKASLKTSSKASGKAIAAKVSSKKSKACALKAKAEKPEPTPQTISFAPTAIAMAPRPYEAPARPAAPARSFDPSALSGADIALYRQAFDLNAQGKFDEATELTGQISDKSLIGYIEYSRLMSPAYTASYEDLTEWMTLYGDLPVAMKVWGLAKRKKPAYAPDPAFPVMARGQIKPEDALALADGNAVRLSSTSGFAPGDPGGQPLADLPVMTADLTPKSARSAYNDGKLEQAAKLGTQVGDRWVAGLATFRLKRYTEAQNHFEFIAKDPSQNAWSRAGGAYWAGRCALLAGQPEEAQIYFKLAASFPFTFYGLVAEQKLGIESAVTRARKGLPPLFAPEERNVLSASLDADFNWTRSDAQAKRIAALILIDRRSEARIELQTAVQRASDQTTRDRWLALAAWSNLSVSGLTRSDKLFDFSSYEVPDYRPVGGFTLDRALVYALARKESKFNPKAVSYSGAYGLMQLMPATAALVTDDSTYRSKPAKLLKPGVNMRVGQDYIHRLLDTQIIKGDLLRAVAAYNGGPRPVQDALTSIGPNADSLLVMESIPVAQSRAYVEEVVAAYWIYQKLMDKPSATLKQAASDAPIISAYDDARLAEKANAEKVSDKASAEKPAKTDAATIEATPVTVAKVDTLAAN